MTSINVNSSQFLSLDKRVGKLLDFRPENDKETLEALKELSTFFTDNNLNCRRSLRSITEKRSLSINDEFLSAFREVKSTLDNMYADVLSMNSSIQTMTDRLKNTKTQTLLLIDRMTALQNKNKQYSINQEIVEAFIRKFQLSRLEISILHGQTRDEPITEEFFDVLNSLQAIHSNCKIFMQSGYQTLGLDVMQRMTLLQEGALERIYRWTQSQCRHIENDNSHSLIMKAMCQLQHRPVLFKYIIDEYCTTRRSLIVDAFIDALTLRTKDKGGSINPIEMRADDPTRYVGDMLAWLHQAIPVEKENIMLLLKSCDETETSDQVTNALGHITEGLCYPLRSRIEHILAVEAPATVLYSVMSLIRYYLEVFINVIPDSILINNLKELLQLSEKSFYSRLTLETRSALGERAEPPGQDLAPAASVNRLLILLNDVLSVALIVTGEDREKDIQKIVSFVVDPLLQEINETAAKLPAIDMAVYLLNCLYQISSTLSLYEYMDQRLERLQAQSDAQIDTLTSELASSLVANLNLAPIYTILQKKEQGPLSLISGMDPINLKEFTNKLESLLLMPDAFLLPQISLLRNPNNRSTALKRSFQVIGAIYKHLYEALHDPKNLYPSPNLILTRTPESLLEKLLNQSL